MLFRLDQNFVQQLPTAGVIDRDTQRDGVVVGMHSLHFELQVVLELLFDVGAHANDVVARDFGHPFQEEDAIDEHLRVLHFANGFVVVLRGQPIQTPVLAHFGLHEVLIDRRQFDRESRIERVDHLLNTLHDCLLLGH